MTEERKPKLTLTQGADQPRREWVSFPPVTDAHAEPPDWLVGPEAVEEWHRLFAQLRAVGILTVADLTTLGFLCNMHAHVVLKWRAGGKPTAAYLREFRLMAKEFGLAPTTASEPMKGLGEGGFNPLAKHGDLRRED